MEAVLAFTIDDDGIGLFEAICRPCEGGDETVIGAAVIPVDEEGD